MGKTNQKPKKYAVSTTEIRKTKRTKRRIKRPVVLFKEDLGSFERTMKISLPAEMIAVDESVIPKEANPNLFWIMQYPIKIIFYLDTEKGFFYDEHGIFLGKFEKHDLKRLFFKIGTLLKTLKKQNG
jgi:hypothetical protein